MVADHRAFSDLGARLGERLAHLRGDEAGVRLLLAPQDCRHRAQEPGAAGRETRRQSRKAACARPAAAIAAWGKRAR